MRPGRIAFRAREAQCSKLERGWEASGSRGLAHARRGRERGAAGRRTTQAGAPVVDDLPNPEEAKRRELREAALKQVIAGKATVRDIQGSKVVKLGKAAAEPGAAGRGPVRRARAREDGQDLRRAGRVRRRARSRTTRTRTPNPNTPGPATFDGPLHNKIPAPDRSKDNSTVWQPDYNRDHYQQLYFGSGESTAQDVLRAPVVRSLQRRRPGHRLGQGPLQRGALRPQRRVPVRRQRLLATPGT